MRQGNASKHREDINKKDKINLEIENSFFFLLSHMASDIIPQIKCLC